MSILVSCVGSRGLGFAALVSMGGRVSQWSADVAVWSFQVERGGGRRCAAVEGGLSDFCDYLLITVTAVNKNFHLTQTELHQPRPKININL